MSTIESTYSSEQLQEIIETHPIMLFDGVCNLCNSTVQFVIKQDKQAKIKLAALQSDIGQQLLKKYELPTSDFGSFIFIEQEKIYTRSSAALRVVRYFSGVWPLCYVGIFIPKFLRDAVYRVVARNRYKWFGKQTACMLPTAANKARFL